jgi:hypothetical protein
MRVGVLRRIIGLLLIVAYAAAMFVAATSPLAACPALDRTHHAGHQHGLGHTHHHDERPSSHPGDCLNCCMGACLLGTSLPAPLNSASSLAFNGTRVIYACEQSVLADRSIPPDPTPPKPTT